MLQRLIPTVLPAVTAGALPARAQALIGRTADQTADQTAEHTGTVAATVKEATAGARPLFDALNVGGVIGGQKLELVVLHDTCDRPRPQFDAIARRLVSAGARAVLFLGPGTEVVECIQVLRAAGFVKAVREQVRRAGLDDADLSIIGADRRFRR